MLSPVKVILSYFGYVKIPLAAVQLSIAQEEAFKIIVKHLEQDGVPCVGVRKALEGQRALTAFLRSGMIST